MFNLTKKQQRVFNNLQCGRKFRLKNVPNGPVFYLISFSEIEGETNVYSAIIRSHSIFVSHYTKIDCDIASIKIEVPGLNGMLRQSARFGQLEFLPQDETGA